MAHINPALQAANQNTAAPLKSLMQMAQSFKDPMSFLQVMCARNPQLQPLMQCLKENGGDAKAAFYSMAQQKGVDPDEIIHTIEQMK